MVEHNCNRCKRVFNEKSTYNDHINRKYKCKLVKSKLNPNESKLNPNESKLNPNKSK